MFDFIDILTGYIETLGNYISNFLGHLALAFSLLVQLFSTPMALVGYMPPFVGASVMAVLLIYLLRFLLGR